MDEFHREAAGHGWPKLCLTNNLRHFQGGFICVVSLQVLQPVIDSGPVTGIRKPPLPIRRYWNTDTQETPFIKNLSQNGAHCDAVLQTADWQHINVHRFVLATKSLLFRKILSQDQWVPFVYKTDHTMEELRFLIDMIYLDKFPEKDTKLSRKLYEMACHYQIPALERALQD